MRDRIYATGALVVFVALLFLGGVRSGLCATNRNPRQTKSPLTVRQVSSVMIYGEYYIPIEYRYKGKEPLELVEVRVYTLLQSGRRHLLLKGAVTAHELGRGTYKLTGHIPERYRREYGSVRKTRVELWYKDKLRHSLTKPRPKAQEEWWVETEERRAVPGLQILEIDIRELKRKMEDRND